MSSGGKGKRRNGGGGGGGGGGGSGNRGKGRGGKGGGGRGGGGGRQPATPSKAEREASRRAFHEKQMIARRQEIQASKEAAARVAVDQARLKRLDASLQVVEAAALDRCWLDRSIVLVPYLPQDALTMDPVVLETLIKALQALLEAPYHVFWSHVLHDAALQRFLDTYLRFAPRPHDRDPPPRTKEYQVLHGLTFRVLHRMGQARESKSDWMEPRAFAGFIRTHHLWTVPKVLDVCVLFAAGASTMVSKMVTGLFRTEPSLASDLNHMVGTTVRLLTRMLPMATNEPAAFTGDAKAALDVDCFLTDTVATLAALVNVYPKAAAVLQRHDMLRIVVLAHRVWIPKLLQPELGPKLGQRLALLRRLCVHLGFYLFKHGLVRYVFAKDHSYNATAAANMFEALHVMAQSEGKVPSHVTPDSFLGLQQHHFALSNVLKKLEQGNKRAVDGRVDSKQIQLWVRVLDRVQVPATKGGKVISKAEQLSPEEMSKISGIRDILPDVGEGFVWLVLQSCDMDPEAALNALLTDQLTAEVSEVPRQLSLTEALSPPQAETTTSPASGKAKGKADAPVYEERDHASNTSQASPSSQVHPSQDLVQLRQDVASSVVHMHRGKRRQEHGTWQELLDDRKAIPFNYASFMYEDEYDDTLEQSKSVALDASTEPEEDTTEANDDDDDNDADDPGIAKKVVGSGSHRGRNKAHATTGTRNTAQSRAKSANHGVHGKHNRRKGRARKGMI